MMTFDSVKELFNTLPSEKQTEVIDFIQFLHYENHKSAHSYAPKRFPFDIFSNSSFYIAEDFDDIPEGFEDYV